MDNYIYGKKETSYLSKVCPKMKSCIKKYGQLERPINSDVFEVLIDSIVSQQISLKAANTVFNRLKDLGFGVITPSSLNSLSIEEIKSCGMSYIKAGYIKSAIDAANTNTVDFKNLHLLSDDLIIESLTKIKGVGIWTAQMLLIFSLGRENVLSYNDLAIRNGLIKLHNLSELKKKDFNKYIELYSPFGTVASFYIWEYYMDSEKNAF